MDERRRKLKFRAYHRGFREMDLLMGSFADQAIVDMSDAELDEFECLLDVPDWDVYAWLIGKTDVPDNYRGPVMDKLLAFRFAAMPG